MDKTKMISFEEYSKIQYEDLKYYLQAFKEEEIRAYWEKNQDWVKKSYNDFIERTNGGKVHVVPNGLAYAMSLDF